MRKSIKGALELKDTKHTSSVLDTYDVAHFISSQNENKVHIIRDKNIPLIVSALNSENDECANYIDFKFNKDKTYKTSVSLKSVRFLNEANVVLVPSIKGRDFLINSGVISDIRVLVPGVNLSRFNFLRTDEKNLFNRYTSRNEEQKLILGLGDYIKGNDNIQTFIKCADAYPNGLFYYIYPHKDVRLRHFIRKHQKMCPKNVKIIGPLTDDLYRSALMNADALIFSSKKPVGAVTVCDAMASKCQIFMIEDANKYCFLENGKTAIIAPNEEDLSNKVRLFFENELQPTTDGAYEFIKQHTLNEYGEELLKIYNEQISLKNKGE